MNDEKHIIAGHEDAIIEQVGDYMTESLHLVSCEKTDIHCIVIPGNPGCLGYYIDFINRMQQKGVKNIHGLSLGGFGHMPTLYEWSKSNGMDHHNKEFKAFSIHMQIQVVTSFLENLQKSRPNARFIILGHSIGAYIGMQIMKHRPDIPIIHHYLLFPFIKNDLSFFNRFYFRILFLLRPILSFISNILSYLPKQILLLLLHVFGNVTDKRSAQTTIKSMLTPYGTTNALYMGETEFNTVPKKFDSELYKQQAHKLTMIYAKHFDHWAPVSQLAEIRKCVPEMRIYIEKCNHAFVLNDQQVEIVSEKCATGIIQLTK